MKENKGITLIALVVAIIIMLILAGVTIGLLINGRLIDYAKEAKIKQEEQVILEDIMTMIQLSNDGTMDVEEMIAKIKEKYVNATFHQEKEVLTVVGEHGTYYYDITEDEIRKHEIEEQQLVNYTMMYDSGNECEDITGGWNFDKATGTGEPTHSKTSSSLYIYSQYSKVCRSGYYYTSPINISSYAVIGCKIKSIYTNATTSKCIGLQSRSAIDCGAIEGTTACNIGQDFEGIMSARIPVNSPEEVCFRFVTETWKAGTAKGWLYNAWLAKQDNWQELCALAGLNSSDYTDEANLCNDSVAMTAILSNENAVKYLVKKCTGSFMTTFINNEIALSLYNNSQFKNIIDENEHWNKFIRISEE